MDEHSMSSYVWLCEQTSLPICGPETAEGKMHARAEWIKAGACDMLRGGVGDVGGITPLIKIAHLAESFGMPAWRCSSAEEVGPRLREALALDLPSLIVVPIDYSMDVAISEELGTETVVT